MKDVKQAVIQKIKQTGMTPRPRWEFMLLRTVLWVAAALSVILGGLAVSVIVRELSITEWDLVPRVIGGPLRALLVVLPYLWIGCLLITLFLAILLFRHTKQGYRHQPLLFVGIAIVASVVIGIFLHASHFDLALETYLVHTIRPYEHWIQYRDELYEAPEHGFLAGTITAVQSENQFAILSIHGNTWTIDASHAVVTDDFSLQPGVHVVMIGTVVGDSAFRADEIRPLRRYYRRTYINVFSRADERKFMQVL